MEGTGRNRLTQDSNQWQGPVNTLMKLAVTSKVRNFLFNISTHGFPGTYIQAGDVGILSNSNLQEGARMVFGGNNTQIYCLAYVHRDLIAPYVHSF